MDLKVNSYAASATRLLARMVDDLDRTKSALLEVNLDSVPEERIFDMYMAIRQNEATVEQIATVAEFWRENYGVVKEA